MYSEYVVRSRFAGAANGPRWINFFVPEITIFFSSFLFRWILFPCVHRTAHGRISSYTQMIAFENDKYKMIEEISIEVRFLLSAFDLFALTRVSLSMNWSDERNQTIELNKKGAREKCKRDSRRERADKTLARLPSELLFAKLICIWDLSIMLDVGSLSASVYAIRTPIFMQIINKKNTRKKRSISLSRAAFNMRLTSWEYACTDTNTRTKQHEHSRVYYNYFDAVFMLPLRHRRWSRRFAEADTRTHIISPFFFSFSECERCAHNAHG